MSEWKNQRKKGRMKIWRKCDYTKKGKEKIKTQTVAE